MTDLEALYRAVLEHPDDDTPRLIYADALEDSGNAGRASFIRAHVAADRVPPYDSVAIRFRLHDLPALGDWPLETLPELPAGLNWVEQPFRRGFPAAVEAGDGAAFVAHWRELFAIAPVQELHLDAIPLPNLAGLVECPGLSRIAKFVLREGAIGITAERLLASPHLMRLDDLYVGSQMSTDGTDVAVVRSPAFARLRAFGCRNVRWPEPLFREINRLDHPPRLVKLNLAGNSIGFHLRMDEPDYDDHCFLFERIYDRIGEGLRELCLDENDLGDEGLELLASIRMPSLRSLSLRQTRADWNGLARLSHGGFIPNLVSLDLSGNYLGRRGADLLVEMEPFENLRILNLSGNGLDVDDAFRVGGSEFTVNLALLDLRDNGLSPEGIAELRERFGDRVLA